MEPKILHKSPYPGDHLSVVRASTVVFKIGWPVSWESNTAVNMDAATEDATFLGLAETFHENGDTRDLVCGLKLIAEFDCSSATFDVGAGLKYSAGSASVAYSLVADGSANTIANAWGYQATVTRVVVDIDVRNLKKLYSQSA